MLQLWSRHVSPERRRKERALLATSAEPLRFAHGVLSLLFSADGLPRLRFWKREPGWYTNVHCLRAWYCSGLVEERMRVLRRQRRFCRWFRLRGV